MYVITFYSFKGGVGRTMALVNVAAELVRRGRKVLVVDFDLEAPGLETYKHLRPPKPFPGIVEYVTEFRRAQQVPNLLDHVYEARPIGKKGGRLWVMPAGRRDRAYRSALAGLDWARLYEDEGGFLLFEDTKKGWEAELEPDYVLIDSRTGDTDVLGICTRQLPDSVVLMFAPNEQNLAGLENVCPDIRREETEGLKKTIRLHFVAANVPDLDDEKRILRRQLQAFRERLAFTELSGTIRRYDNLNLLDQSVVALDHPHSRLARSYRRLLRVLLKDNLVDRDGATFFLKDYPGRIETRDIGEKGVFSSDEPLYGHLIVSLSDGRSGYSVACWEDKQSLNRIARSFNDDLEILAKVADCFVREEDYRSAVRVLDRVLLLEPTKAEAFFRRAVCNTHLGEIDNAGEDLLACLRVLSWWSPSEQSVLSTPGVVLNEFGRVLQHGGLQQECLARLCVMAPAKLEKLAEMVETQQIQGVELWIVTRYLCRREEGVPIAARLLRNSIAGSEERDESVGVQALLQARCWREVIQLHEAGRFGSDAGSLLGLALAHWGENGEMPESICRQALGSDEQYLTGAWGLEAKSWLLWRVGEAADAIDDLDKAEQRAHAEPEEVFSLWRLREVSIEQYLDDCGLVRRMFQGEPLRPAFLGPPGASTLTERTSR